MSDIKDFLTYILHQSITATFSEFRNLVKTLFKMKLWVILWALVFVATAFTSGWRLKVASFIMFLVFFTAYHWQSGEYKHWARERWRKKHNLPKR